LRSAAFCQTQFAGFVERRAFSETLLKFRPELSDITVRRAQIPLRAIGFAKRNGNDRYIARFRSPDVQQFPAIKPTHRMDHNERLGNGMMQIVARKRTSRVRRGAKIQFGSQLPRECMIHEISRPAASGCCGTNLRGPAGITISSSGCPRQWPARPGATDYEFGAESSTRSQTTGLIWPMLPYNWLAKVGDVDHLPQKWQA